MLILYRLLKNYSYAFLLKWKSCSWAFFKDHKSNISYLDGTRVPNDTTMFYTFPSFNMYLWIMSEKQQYNLCKCGIPSLPLKGRPKRKWCLISTFCHHYSSVVLVSHIPTVSYTVTDRSCGNNIFSNKKSLEIMNNLKRLLHKMNLYYMLPTLENPFHWGEKKGEEIKTAFKEALLHYTYAELCSHICEFWNSWRNWFPRPVVIRS